MLDFLSNIWGALQLRFLFHGANEVVIYNFLALLTIDTNINQFTKVYHNFYKIQYKLLKKHKNCLVAFQQQAVSVAQLLAKVQYPLYLGNINFFFLQTLYFCIIININF